MTLNDREKRILSLTKALVNRGVNELPPYALGHGFLWGRVTFNRRLKNGKLKTFAVKVLFGGICVNDFNKAVEIAESVPGVSGCYVNLD